MIISLSAITIASRPRFYQRLLPVNVLADHWVTARDAGRYQGFPAVGTLTWRCRFVAAVRADVLHFQHDTSPAVQ